MQKFLSQISESKSVAIFSHKNPDPDAIGSALALCKLLEAAGKRVGLFCSGEMSGDYRFLAGFEKYNTTNPNDYELFLAVDVASSSMLGDNAELFLAHDKTIRIDHHSSGENFAKINVCEFKSACAILIFDIAQKLSLKITPEVATLLYFAICGDTGIFKNTNTDSETFEVCAKLLKLGADAQRVYGEFFDKKTIAFVKLTSMCLLGAEFDEKGNFAIMSATEKDFEAAGAESTESISNLPHTYLSCGLKMVVILKEQGDEVRCSLRSKADFDCTKVAEVFGGGGHKNASGCTIHAPLREAKVLMKNALENYFSKI